MPGMRIVLLLALTVTALPAFAQVPGKGRGQEGRPPAQNMSHEERRRLREDVDSARGTYDRRDPRRQGRMPPEEREKLRRDVLDANRDMRKK
jgi:hypothetical protein